MDSGMDGEIGRDMDTHIDADGVPDVYDVNDTDGEVISSRSTDSYIPPTHADTTSDSTNSNTASSHSNTQTHSINTTSHSTKSYSTNTQAKARKPMLIPIPTDKGVELLQLPDYIPPRKDVWRELRTGDDEEGDAGVSARGDGADAGCRDERGGDRGGGGEEGDDEYAPLSIVSSSYPSHSSSHPSSFSYPHNPSSYTPYTPSSSSYPSFTLNLGVEESPLGALTPLTPMTPRTPCGRWFDPVQPSDIQRQPSERDGTFDESDNDDRNKDTGVSTKGKSKQKEDKENDKEYVDGDCGICFEEAVRPTLTPCCASVFCAEHLDEWLQGTESDGRCPACKKRLDLSSLSSSQSSYYSSRSFSRQRTSDNGDGSTEEHGKYAGGRGVETTSAWKWLASWLVPEPTATSSAQHHASSAQSASSSHSHPQNPSSAAQSSATRPSNSQIHQIHQASLASSSQQPPMPTSQQVKAAQNRGRYGSPYTPYPYTPITGTPGAGTPITPGTPPATQGFIPMAPVPLSQQGSHSQNQHQGSQNQRQGSLGRGRSAHPLSEHVEQERAVQEGGKDGGEFGAGGEEEEGGKEEKEERASGSSSASTSTSRSNSSPEIAGEGSSSSTCTTPPLHTTLPTLPCSPAIVVDGDNNEKLSSVDVDAGGAVEKSPLEGVGGDVDVEVEGKRQTRVEDVDLVGMLSRFLSLVGLLGLFYVLLS